VRHDQIALADETATQLSLMAKEGGYRSVPQLIRSIVVAVLADDNQATIQVAPIISTTHRLYKAGHPAAVENEQVKTRLSGGFPG
jgi:hypothetical protein